MPQENQVQKLERHLNKAWDFGIELSDIALMIGEEIDVSELKEDDLVLMRRYSDNSVEVKAAGGVRTLEDTLKVRALGVTRIGATATETILQAVEGQNAGESPEGY